jgi:hypothetical protein
MESRCSSPTAQTRRRPRLWPPRPMWRLWWWATIPSAMPAGTCPTPSNGKESVDRKTIVLEQEELVKQVFAANPRTIEVLRASFPYAIVWSQQNLPAIVHMTHNSQEEGHGLADVLFGDYSPAGRLTQTWPTGDAQLLPILDYNLLHGRTYLYSKDKPLYAFGYGLSYTSFAYEGLSLSAPKVAADGTVQVTVKVKNTGKRAGRRGGPALRAAFGLGRAATIGTEGIQAGKDRGRGGAGGEAGAETARPGLLGRGGHVWRVEKEQVRVLAGGSSDKLPVQATRGGRPAQSSSRRGEGSTAIAVANGLCRLDENRMRPRNSTE